MLSLVTQIQQHVQNQPTKTCLSYVTSKDEHHINYWQLHQEAMKIAAYLSCRLDAQDRVLLVFPSGIEFVCCWLGCVYAGMIAVPIMPPTNAALMHKTLNIIKNANPKVSLIASALEKDAQQKFCGIDALYLHEVDSTSDIDPILNQQHVAFLQYTSGSTGNPKGVIINNQNLNHNLQIINHSMDMENNTVHCSWLPPHHDMGLIGFILASLFGGHRSIIMPPFSFLQNPLFWLQTITRFRVNLSGGPDFAFEYCVKRIRENKKAELDLSSWRVAPNGAEPVQMHTLTQFYEAFKDYGFDIGAFRPCYGLAEATLMVSNRHHHSPIKYLNVDAHQLQDHRVQIADSQATDSMRLVSSGAPVQEVVIVDPNTLSPCEENVVGEIWIASPSVSPGYWANQRLTMEQFRVRYKNQTSKIGYLRSGDLGFIYKNELYITGRIKDLIIISGKNHYPQDIEASIVKSGLDALIGRVAAYALIQNGRDFLGIMVEVRNQYQSEDEFTAIALSLRKTIASCHAIDLYDIAFIPFKKLPHTTSGKIRRQACKEMLTQHEPSIVYRWQKKIALEPLHD